MGSPGRKAGLARSRRYQRISVDRAVGTRTHFFAAASLVAKALATHDQPSFLSKLGAKLEVENVRRAREIRAGRLYRDGSPLANTADFVRHEQLLVELELERLRAADPPAFDAVIASANAQIERSTRGLSRLMNRRFVRAVVAMRRELGRPFDFARRDDRERLGNAVAREALRRW
ncbi:MAG TPA: hypothetical protein VMF52_17080 [Steroidobacteraceae bacterium]|nr:hypothetical protein [Steroidobacteraceae bacterium]